MECPDCRIEIPEDSIFCKGCGNKLADTGSTPATNPTMDGERKRVTIMFSDLSGYTAMTGQLDPEEVKAIMSRIFGEVARIIEQYDAFIEKFIGDAVMAVFGVPKAHEDDPIRAIRSALEIHSAVEAISPQIEGKIGRSLSMHTGVNTGLVVTSEINIEKGIHGLTGDTINIASRLGDLAAPGEILVGKDTYKATSNHFTFESIKPIQIKGKSEPIPIYKLISAESITYASDKGRQVSSEMVGRDQEMSKLELHVLKAINGEGSIVNVIGEAGIGKSRLIAELKNRQIMKKVALREGRAISMGKGLSFYPVIDIYKNWAKINENDSDAVAISKLKASIRRVMPKDVDEILPFIATLIGIKPTGRYAERLKGIEGEALEKLILKSVKDLLIKSSEIIPLVIIIEDLHWADISTIEMLEALFQLAKEQRILFINIFRPKYTKTGGRIIHTVINRFPNHYVETELLPLNDKMSEKLIRNMLSISGLPYNVIKKIVKRAGGNPFFIEEVLRSFIDDGAIVRVNGGFEVTEKLDNMVIPHSINDVLIARIDRLEEKTRELVKTASVIGRSFFHRILTEVAKNLEGIDKRLEYLKDIQLIRDRFRLEELEYIFKHALTQEAAYGTLLVQNRKELHLIVAQTIEKVFSDKLYEFYGMLAYHYSKGEDLDKSEEYMIKAGEEALRTSASSEALNYYKEALELYLDRHKTAPDERKLSMFEKNIALALFYKGKDVEAIEYFDRVLDRWGIGPPKNKIVVVLKLLFDLASIILGIYLPPLKPKKIPNEKDNEIFNLSYIKAESLVQVNIWRNLTEQIGIVRRALRFDLNMLENGIIFPLSISGIFGYIGFFNLESKCLDYASKFLNKDNIKEYLAYSFYENLHKFYSGKWDEVKEYDDKLIESNAKLGEFWHISCYLTLHTWFEAARGNHRKSQRLLKQLHDISEIYESDCAKVWYYFAKMQYCVSFNEFEEVERFTDQSISFAQMRGLEIHLIYYLSFKAYTQTIFRNFQTAEEYLKKTELIISKHKIVPPMFMIIYRITKFLVGLLKIEDAQIAENLSAAKKYIKMAKHDGKIALRDANKLACYRFECLRLKGTYYWLVGNQKKAINWWLKALTEAESLGARPNLARIYMEIGRRLLEKKSRYKELNGTSAKKYLEIARDFFVKMDLQWDLDELDKIIPAT